ncbi:MAG: hypothetical protein Q9197_005641 [Variospora fuerteventurae]
MAPRTKRKFEDIIKPEQSVQLPRTTRKAARRHLLPIEQFVPKDVPHLLNHSSSSSTGLKPDVATTKNLTSCFGVFTQGSSTDSTDTEAAVLRDKAHYQSIAAGRQEYPYVTLMAMAHAANETPNQTHTAPTHQAPMDPSLTAYAPARLHPPAPARTVQAIPAEQLMPWFPYSHDDPSRAARTLPDPSGTLINNDPHSPLNRNRMKDLPANLNAAFPLPEPCLNNYSLPSVASFEFGEGPPPPRSLAPPQPSQQDLALNYGNLIRQINTYCKLGLSWVNIVGNLSKAGYGAQLTVEAVKKIYEDNQGKDLYHYTGFVGEQKAAAEPGDFACGGVEAAAAGRFDYPKG